VATYGGIARALNRPKYARYVGFLLKSNPEPDKYPCYKVVKSDGAVGGYSGPSGIKEKIRRLEKENVIIKKSKVINFESKIFNFNAQ
jgi:O6-methylguanine-DNA--protein-cysteine methyltransferase